MELWEGSDLFTEYWKTKDVMKEIDAAVLMKTIIKALIHWHANNIIHRDIKLENIMFKSKEITDYSDIQLIDFGLSKSKEGGFGMLSTIVGSPYFTAPEVFEGNYGKEWDVWSCGVVLYVLLGGDYPYNADTIPSLYSKIQRKDPKFKPEKWGNISSEAKDLIKSMLNRNPDKRISFDKCLKHKWFDIIDEQQTDENGYVKEYGEVVGCLKKYNGLTLLK